MPGHWEGDLLVGHANASALGTWWSGPHGLPCWCPLKAKDAATVRQTFARELRTLPRQLRRSLTYDQGPEMREHRLFTKQTKMRVYFAHPHSPWSEARMRTRMACCASSFPRGRGSRRCRARRSSGCSCCLNDRPRKILDWHSPAHAHLLLGSECAVGVFANNARANF